MNINTLGLMKRAGALEIGQDRALASVKEHKAKVLLLPSDVTERAERNAQYAAEGRKNPKIIVAPWTNEEISKVLGIGSCLMLAVTDRGFADALLKDMGGN